MLATTWIATADPTTIAQTPTPNQTWRVETLAEHVSNWLESFWSAPLVHFLTGSDSTPADDPAPAFSVAQLSAITLPPCQVEPLDPITDPDAEEFEDSSHNGSAVDISGMTRDAQRGLARFEKTVDAVGGEMELKSVYRPPAYQAHLKDVWNKWQALRDNTALECQDLRAQIGAEFEHHHLLLTQTPVSVSDHTRGLAFDAAVVLPPGAHLNRRRLNLDLLARLTGFRRPDILHDPVHFKFIGVSGRRG